MRRQTWNKYIFCRIEFSIAVGLFVEFDYETPLWSDFPFPRDEDELIEIKEQILKFEQPSNENIIECATKGDISFPCMKFASIAKMSPQKIAQKLKPYVEHWEFLERVEIVGGYLNMYYDRVMFLENFDLGRMHNAL